MMNSSLALKVFLAQQPVVPTRHFDIADGFAITLIAMLMGVLGGIALVARRFRSRERERHLQDEGVEETLRGGQSGDSPEVPRPRGERAVSQGSSGSRAPWERDADWWKGGDEPED